MDIGQQTTSAIFTTLQVDAEWSVQAKRGFRWWADGVAQEVLAGPVRTFADGAPWARVVVRTPMLSRPGADAATVAAALNAMNEAAPVGAFRQDAEGRVVHELAAHTTNEVWQGVARILATGAILALTSVLDLAEANADALGSSVLRSSHPDSGPRPAADDILNVTDQLVVPLGLEASRWADGAAEFSELANWVNGTGSGIAFDTECEQGFLCEFGFGDEATSLAGMGSTSADGVSLSHVGLPPSVPHPQLGNGLVAWLVLPIAVAPDTAYQQAAALNAREADAAPNGDLHPAHLGAWVITQVGGSPSLAYRLFVPNMLNELVTATFVVLHLMTRARWVSAQLEPNVEPLGGQALLEFMMRRLNALTASTQAGQVDGRVH